MKKKYISPSTRILKAGTKDYVLNINVYEGSQGTTDGFSKNRGQIIEDDSESDNGFWSTKY